MPTSGKNRYVDRYAWGKFFLRDTLLVLLWYFFKQGKVWGKFLYKNEWINKDIGQMYSKANLEKEKN